MACNFPRDTRQESGGDRERGQGEGERAGEDQDEELVSKHLFAGLKRREKDSRTWEGQRLRERTPW